MADLSKANLLNERYSREPIFVSITKKGTGHSVLSKHGGGKFIPTKFIIDGKEYVVSRCQPKQLVDAISKHNKLVMVNANGVERPLGHLEKTQDYKTGKSYNNGDIAEGVFGCAILARFMNKNRNITAADVETYMRQLGKSPKQKLGFQSPNDNPDIKDDVELTLGLAKNNIEALCDVSIRQLPDIQKITAASVKYANSGSVMKWAETVYNNNVYNKIAVVADGTANQTETKVDVAVFISTHTKELKKVDINVSLKAGDVKQFGQISGSGFDVQIKLWKQVFDIDVSSQKRVYNDYLKKTETQKALQHVYTYVSKELEKKLTSDNDGTLKAFATAIRYHATRNEENVQLVQLNSGKAKVYTFDNLEKAFEKIGNIRAEVTLKADVKVGSSGLPQIDVYADGINASILRIRAKTETKNDGSLYFRNIFEKLSGLGDLIADYAGEDEKD